MTSNLVITVETLDNVLWVPFQALFESDGRTFVYAKTPNGFMPHDVKMVRRSESQVAAKYIHAWKKCSHRISGSKYAESQRTKTNTQLPARISS